ncbi:hypothetical protein ACOMHN_056890 [Nucella lapillus]
MSVQYQRIGGDDIDDDDDVVCQPGGHAHFPNGSGVSLTQALPTRQLRWPTVIGIIQIVLGTLIALLGVYEVFILCGLCVCVQVCLRWYCGLCVFEVLILPIMDDHTATVQFNKSTCYGAAIYAGLVMVISGSLAVRASLTKRKTTVHSFYHLSVVTVLLYAVVTVVLIAAYSLNWNSDAAYPADSSRSGVHLALTLLVVGGMVCGDSTGVCDRCVLQTDSSRSGVHLALTLLVVGGMVCVVTVQVYMTGVYDRCLLQVDSSRSGVHLAVTLLVVGGMVCVVSAVVHYHHAVCFGHLNLWHWWTHCLCSACSQQVGRHWGGGGGA